MTNNGFSNNDSGEPQPLAEVRPPNVGYLYFGATISIAPTMLANRSLLTHARKQDFVRWELLTPAEQKAILCIYIDRCYKPEADTIDAGFEFSQSKMVHAHLCLGIKAEEAMSDYMLQTLRVMVQRRHDGAKVFRTTKYTKHMNYIHDLKKKGYTQWQQYIRKDIGCMPQSFKLFGNA